MKLYGLIGYPLQHSFSQTYFTQKFKTLGLNDCSYQNFELENIEKLNELLDTFSHLQGLNITIPYKESVLPFLDSITSQAQAIGAVNCIHIRDKKLHGHNTDAYGFENSLLPYLNHGMHKALILGTGGSAKAIEFALNKLNIQSTFVSRSALPHTIQYEQLDGDVLKEYLLIINCTPLGTFPNIATYPNIPYASITPNHICFDLVYNPSETAFMKRSKQQGATVINGLNMLHLQAEKSWEIWNNASEL
jgi:shikimate dehydrogenase